MNRRALTAAPAALTLAATALISGAAPATAARVTGCDSSSYGRAVNQTVCGTVRYDYIPGTCNPVRFDVKSVRVRVTDGLGALHNRALYSWDFEVTRGNSRDDGVVFARYNRTVYKDLITGRVSERWRSVSMQPQGRGHLSMGGRVDVAHRRDWTASINVDIPPRSGCLA